MKDWLISICVTVILITILQLISPEGKIGKFVKGYFSILMVFVLLQPFVKLDLVENVVIKNQGVENVVYKTDYLEFINKEKITKLEKNCVKLSEKVGIKDISVKIEYNVDDNFQTEIKKVNLNLSDAVIILDKAHIDIIEELKDNISQYLSVNKNLVVIYE